MTDPRCHPIIDLDRDRLRAMLRPLLGGADVRGVSRVEGGLVNTTYRVVAGAGHPVYGVRVYASGHAAFEAELRLLRALSGALPVPEVLLADAGGSACAHPFLAYRWIEGITLNDCRRRVPADELLALAEPLGRLAARVAAIRPDAAKLGPLPAVRVADRLERADRQLRAGPARARLGAVAADGLRGRLAAAEPLLRSREHAPVLLHGDFGGRNLLVGAAAPGRWEVRAVLDWETAAYGAALWDVGSLFRYSRRYSPEFRGRFARGCRAAGGELGGGWWQAAKLLDATRLVDILSEERELPTVFAECRDLVAAILSGEALEPPDGE